MSGENYYSISIFVTFAADRRITVNTVVIAQLVRASDCGSEGRRFEPG